MTTADESKYVNGRIYEMSSFDGRNQRSIPVIKVDEDTAQYYAFREVSMTEVPKPIPDPKPDSTFFTINIPLQIGSPKIRVHKKTGTVVGHRCSGVGYCLIDPVSIITDVKHARIEHYYPFD